MKTYAEYKAQKCKEGRGVRSKEVIYNDAVNDTLSAVSEALGISPGTLKALIRKT